MKINELKSIHGWVRSTDIPEIVFVSSLILPIYFLLYNTMINQINPDWRNWTLAGAFTLYVIGIVWMKNNQSIQEKNLRDLLIIKNHILDKGYQFLSFKRIAEIDNRFTEERVKQLLLAFPNELRLATLKEGKKGIKILDLEIRE